jgi:DNA-binding PadR family transcriptional regulator
MSSSFPARVTKPTLAVARYLISLDGKSTYGMEIGRHTGLGTASVYSVLDRFEDYGWLESSWESDSDRKGARRRLYTLTKQGDQDLHRLLEGIQEDTKTALKSKPSKLQARGA